MKNGKDQPNDEKLYANYLAQGLVGRNNLQMLIVKTSLELNYVSLGGQDFPAGFLKTMLVVRKAQGFE